MENTNGEGPVGDDVEKVQQATADLLKDAAAQAGESAKELSGKAQQLFADMAGVLRTSAAERPFAAIAIAAGVGFILGALHATTRRSAASGDDERD
jgi:ElaB/YqjD/DUF883 family membrane-anchored ribosome-binding protein